MVAVGITIVVVEVSQARVGIVVVTTAHEHRVGRVREAGVRSYSPIPT